MTHAEYMVEKMIEHQGHWTVKIDEDGNKIIVNHNGNGRCRAVQNEDGTIVTAERLIELFNERVKIEA